MPMPRLAASGVGGIARRHHHGWASTRGWFFFPTGHCCHEAREVDQDVGICMTKLFHSAHAINFCWPLSASSYAAPQ